MTPSQILDLLQSRDSFKYFCQTQLVGVSATYIAEGKHNDDVAIESSLAYILWQSLFYPLRTHLIVSESVQRRRFRAEEFERLFDMLNPELYVGMIRHKNKDRVEFHNGSRVIFQSGPHAGRGYSINTLCFDGHPKEENLQAILPCIHATGGTVILS